MKKFVSLLSPTAWVFFAALEALPRGRTASAGGVLQEENS
jgi:hypothetical protein